MLFLQTFLLLVISSLVVFGQHTFSSGSSTYTLIEQPKTWEAAKSYAEGQGGQLLEIDSATEMEVVQNALESYFAGMSSAQRTAFLNATRAPDGGGAAYLWLGGSDAASEGVWRRVSTDQQFWSGDYNGNSVGGAYHNWGTVGGVVWEPDNYQNQDALALGLEAWPYGAPSSYRLGTAYQWNDIDLNSNQLYFIIEKDLGNPGIEPPASIAGKAYQFSMGGDVITSVPLQLEFDSMTYNEGFAGSLIDANRPYTYADGVIYFSEGDELRLSFESSTSGTFEYWEYDDGNYSLDVSGSFTVVSPSLVEKTDWQRTEALDSPLSDQYWNVWRRSVDALAYDDGELSFIFAAGGDSDPDTWIEYGRTLPMDENWQVVLEDIYAAPGLSGFELELELEIDDPEFACELYFADYGYGNGREFGVFLEQQLPSGDWEYAQAYITANEDTRISSGGNVRIVHIASSREWIFEYQPDGASEWSELARLNLESGSFQGENAYGSLTGGILSATGPRMTVEIEAEVQPGVATQIADLEIGGIEIGSYTYTPPAASIAGKGYRITYTDGDLTSVPVDAIFAADSFNYGFSGNLIGSYNYSYEDGVLIWDEEEQMVFNFSSASGGTFQQGYIDEFDGFYVESRGTFKESNIKLSLQTNWPRTETMNKALSSKYWRIETEHSADRVAYDDGELNFIFADDSESSDESEWSGQSHREIELLYAGALPLSEDWQIVVDDTYVSYSVQEFEMGYSLAQEGVFDCEFGFSGYEGVRAVYFYTDGGEDSYNAAYVSSTDDPRIQNGISFRIRHDASSRELIYAYQPDGADDWTELARINLGSGTVSGSKVDGSGLTGPLPSRDQHLFFMVDMDNYATDYQATQIGDLEIGGIQISKGDWKSLLKVSVSLANGITGDGDATVLIDGDPYPVSLVRGKGTLEVAMPTGSTYTVSASLDALTSGDPRSVLMNKAATVSLVLDGDSDEDGLPDSQEARYQGDPNDPDTDDDGILDGAEVNTYRTRVDVADTDKDGLSDYDEINSYSTNALKADSDGDRMSDYAEIEAGTDPTDKSEYPAYLKVQVSLAKGISADGDATVLIDGVSQTVSLVRGKGTLEVAMPTGSTYTVSASLDALTSGDPRSVLMNKAATVSLVLDGDSDEDGLPDSQEARYQGDPNDPDTDDDGILDGAEVNTYRTRVDVADTDKDGLSDYDEINSYSTNALKADSDGDRMSDYAEIEAGTDPTDKSEYPAYLKVQVSLAKGISADGDATVLIDGVSQTVSLVRGKGTLEVAMPTGSTYTVSASLDALTSGDPRSVLMNKAATVSLVLDGDSDEDGLPDSQEARYQGDPNDPDTDDDGILDGAEVNTYRTRVDVADTDKDGFTDKQELDLSTNPLSSKDKPSAYIERPVVVDWLLRYEAEDGYINEDWSTEQLASFLSAAAGDRQDAASIYLKYSLDGSNVKWIVRHEAGDIDVTSLMRPMKVSKPAQLDAVVMSPEAADGSYYGAELFSLGISAGKTKSLSLVVSGESSFSAVGSNASDLEIDLATSSDYKALGMLKDSSMSDGPILIEGILTLGDEVANVLGQVIGPVATGDTASTFN